MTDLFAIFTVNRDIIAYPSNLIAICTSKEEAMKCIKNISIQFRKNLSKYYYTDEYDEPTLAVIRAKVNDIYSLAYALNYDVKFTCEELLDLTEKDGFPKWDDFLVKRTIPQYKF